MAQYFRGDEYRDVLLLVDNIVRFIQAGAEVSGPMGPVPSRLGYPPTLGPELAALDERIANTAGGAITSIQAVGMCRPTTSPSRPRCTPSRTGRRPSCCRASVPARACTRPWTRCRRSR